MTKNKIIKRRSNNQSKYIIRCNDGRTLKSRSDSDLKKDIGSLDVGFTVLKNVEGTTLYVSEFKDLVLK